MTSPLYMNPKARLQRAFEKLKAAVEWADANDDQFEEGTRLIQAKAKTFRTAIAVYKRHEQQEGK